MSCIQKEEITIAVSEKQEAYEGGQPWASAASARVHVDNNFPNGKFNEMPSAQIREKYSFANGIGGDTDASGDVENSSVEKGFKRMNLSNEDEPYITDRCKEFYDTVKNESGGEGFLIRNSYLDRH